MHRFIFFGIAALAVGLVGGWTFVVLMPAESSKPLPTASINVEAPATPMSSPVAQREAPPPAELETPTIGQEGLAQETAARATVPTVGPKPNMSTAPSAPSNTKSPPLILGIRH